MEANKKTAPGASAGAERTSCPIEITCPRCGLVSPITEIRCPRCNALLLTACSGACGSCGSHACMLGAQPDEP
jgi:phage FluMu protein Com